MKSFLGELAGAFQVGEKLVSVNPGRNLVFPNKKVNISGGRNDMFCSSLSPVLSEVSQI